MALPSKQYRWLILPIETKVRELDGKLLLAATAAERGWAVVLGQVEHIVRNTVLIPGAVLEKDGYFGNPRIVPFLESGKRVCALDEEGLVYLSSDDYYRRRLDRQNLRRLDLIFVWGEQQRHDILEHVGGLENKLVPTGNPRFDLLRPDLRAFYEPAAAHLSNRFGRFILINTNFADSNHFMGADWVIGNLRNNRFITNAEQEANERAFMTYQRGILDHFVTLVRVLAASFPEYTIVVRPHPSEDHGTWHEATRSLNNVVVIHEGDVNSWLLAGQVSIHNSCMTGIQAFLLEKPAIAFLPARSERFDYFLPNALSTKADTPAEIVESMKIALSNPDALEKERRSAKLEIAKRYVESVSSGPLASDRIVDALDRLRIAPGMYVAPSAPDPRPAYQASIRRLWAFGRRVVNRLAAPAARSKFSPTDPRYLAYTRQKYPGITAKELQSKLGELQEVTGRFRNLQVVTLAEQTFCLFPR